MSTCHSPTVLKIGVFDMQVCVPVEMKDAEVTSFANSYNFAFTNLHWTIKKEGNPTLNGDPERQPCADRCGFVHIMLEC